MKRVKLIGEKVMSVGLAASLLLAPVNVNKCCYAMQANNAANQTDEEDGVDVISTELLILLFICLVGYYGYENPETVQKVVEVLSESAKGAWYFTLGSTANFCEFIRDNKNTLCKFIKENGDSIINQAKSAGAAGADIIKSLFNFIGLICSSSCNMVRSIYNIFNIIGFKNIFSTIGAGHMTKKVYDFGKGACDKVKNWFKSRPQKQEKKKEVKKINLKGWLKNNKEKIEVNIE